jgi:RHH-type rel operon transcriptional repressor/antitoxin RelB
MESSTISTRINSNTLKKLEKLSKATKRSKSFLAAEAIEKYIEEESWQIQAIKEGIKEANKGNFATEKEISKYHKKWGINGNKMA